MSASGEERAMVENLSKAQIEATFSVIPLELTVLDADDLVVYWNQARQQSGNIAATVCGSDVRACHSVSSKAAVYQVLSDLKTGVTDCVEKKLPDRTVSWHALRDPGGRYLGTLEIIQRFAQASGDGG